MIHSQITATAKAAKNRTKRASTDRGTSDSQCRRRPLAQVPGIHPGASAGRIGTC
ncbi:hypothetical protein ACFY2W_36150 [Streptomyces sp. NPDC001262]|uniref:hypothetical protein n=1 Tax=Streptomyces sp. NPDC001262 TaxID=3364552 RepID=UPI0036C5FD14